VPVILNIVFALFVIAAFFFDVGVCFHLYICVVPSIDMFHLVGAFTDKFCC
jgi:hypothetical protein